MNKILCIVISFITIAAQAQPGKMRFQLAPSPIVNEAEIKVDWNPVLINLEMPEPDAGADEEIKEAAKHLANQLYGHKPFTPQEKLQRSLNNPVLGKNFYGNPYNYNVPNDNDIAVSNGNMVVSVINSTVRIFDLNLDTAYQAVSLFALSSVLGLPNEHFDPKVLYDPQSDRFILACLNGYTDSTSSIVLGFSQSNDPRQGWVFYSVPGNPYNDTLWTDFPMISITQEHLYLTVNLLKNNETWQNGFVKTVVWQFNKADGYNGQILTTNLYGNFKYNGNYIRNMCPVRNGSELFNGTAYFLSNRNFAVSSDTIFLIKIPDSMNADTAAIEVSLLHSNHRYHIPPGALQTPPRKLETNDARILGAFMQNNLIQFVSNTRDTVNNKAAFYHGIINMQNVIPDIQAFTIRNDTVEYGYPNIAYAGIGIGDNTAIIGINYTAANIFPACGAIMSDGLGNYSDLVTIRKGDNYISVLSGAEQRWGDYSGAQRKYNENGVVWLALTYGGLSKKQNTWIAELSPQPFTSAHYVEAVAHINQLYPVPASSSITCNFTLSNEDYIIVDILDVNGRSILQLYREKAYPGLNTFQCNTSSLSDGTYMLLIRNQKGQILGSKQFIEKK